jgi:hypothetical protein
VPPVPDAPPEPAKPPAPDVVPPDVPLPEVPLPVVPPPEVPLPEPATGPLVDDPDVLLLPVPTASPDPLVGPPFPALSESRGVRAPQLEAIHAHDSANAPVVRSHRHLACERSCR